MSKSVPYVGEVEWVVIAGTSGSRVAVVADEAAPTGTTAGVSTRNSKDNSRAAWALIHIYNTAGDASSAAKAAIFGYADGVWGHAEALNVVSGTQTAIGVNTAGTPVISSTRLSLFYVTTAVTLFDRVDVRLTGVAGASASFTVKIGLVYV